MIAGQTRGSRTPLQHKRRGVMRMTNVELFALLIAVASLALTIYFGMKR